MPFFSGVDTFPVTVYAIEVVCACKAVVCSPHKKTNKAMYLNEFIIDNYIFFD
jgi:hypothetical protein